MSAYQAASALRSAEPLRGARNRASKNVAGGKGGDPMIGPRSKLACWVLLCAILQAVTTTAVRAEDPAPPSPWSFQIVPYLWLVGIGGDINGPRESVSVSAGIGDVLSHLDGGLMLLGEAHYRRWFLFGDFDYARLSADGSWG